jgi:hypothetical protein
LAPIAIFGGLGYLVSRLDSKWSVVGADRFPINPHRLRGGGITESELFPGWSLHFQHMERVQVNGGNTPVYKWKEFSGEEAIRLARRALPLLNRRAPKLGIVSDAVTEISSGGGVQAYLAHAAALKPRWVQFRHYPKPILLAMEMALFQDEERRAMEGEIERLEAAWREAEELAAISDNLILPKGWDAFRAEARAAKDQAPPGMTGESGS